MAKGIYIGAENFPKRNLPSGYTQVEYIESTGTQYIDTGFTVNSSNYINLKIEYETIYTSLSGTYYKVHGISGSGLIFYVGCSNSGVVVYGNGKSDQTTSLKGTLGKKTKVVFDMKNKTYTFDGNTVNITATAPSSSGNFHIFGYNKLNGGTDCHEEKICGFKIYDNGTLVRDYVPCTKNGVAGLYDIVNGVFYTNAGTGTFVVDQAFKSVARKVKKVYIGIKQFEPRELPEGYTQVEYIESSGTQYVDTGFKPNNNTRVVMDYNLISGKPPVMFGAMDSWVSKGFAYISNEAMDALTICYGAKYYTPTANAAGRHIIDANKNVFSLDGMVVQTCTEVTFQSNYNLILFGYNNGGTVTTKNTIVYIHSCQIYDNGTIVRDYVPCTNQTGVGGLYDLVNKKFYGNSGTGTFVVGGSATSTARKVKKGYIGIGGVARPFMSGGEVAYYGTITALSQVRGYLAATTVGDYALFGGGYSGSYWGEVDAYNTSLTRTTATDFGRTRRQLAATTVGNYALFGGGYNGSATRANVDAYDTSLTRGDATALSNARKQLSATTVGNYALFAGGDNSSAFNTVDAYNASLSRSTATVLSVARKMMSATTVGDYALFGGGYWNSTYSTVDAYNTSLTRTTATALSQARYEVAATTVGKYALFAGGYNGSTAYKTVDAYDKSLTRTTATSLSVERLELTATTVGDYALFGGGYWKSTYSNVDAYDTSLTRTTATALNTARHSLVATTVGNYALFGGGLKDTTYYATVDAYVVA